MQDDFADQTVALTAPATKAEVIAPDDANELAYFTRAIYVGSSGNLSVVMLSGDTVTLSNIQSGVIYPIRVRQVLSTGTTAAGIVGLR
ncbi:MAG: hypothetical protein AB3N13_00740 [Arenibacterium sp.]